MSPRDRNIIIIAAVLFAAISGYLIWDQIQRNLRGGIEVGKKALDFTVPGPNNTSFTLSEHQGELVIIDFMTKSCRPCQLQLDELALLAEEYEEIVIVSVELDTTLSWDSFLEYAAEKNLTFFMGHDSSVGRSYNVYYIPSILIVDGEGIIRHRGYYTTYDQLKELVNTYL